MFQYKEPAARPFAERFSVKEFKWLALDFKTTTFFTSTNCFAFTFFAGQLMDIGGKALR